MFLQTVSYDTLKGTEKTISCRMSVCVCVFSVTFCVEVEDGRSNICAYSLRLPTETF